jgi:hypothetical protein
MGLQAHEWMPAKKSGFSHGFFAYAADMRFGPRKTRTYLITAVTTERRNFKYAKSILLFFIALLAVPAVAQQTPSRPETPEVVWTWSKGSSD